LIRRSDPPVSPNDPDNNTIDPDLQQMRLQEAVVGVERELSPILTVSARYIHKQLDRVIEDVGTREAPQALLSIWIANPGSGRGAAFYPQDGTTPIAIPRPKRDYDAIEIEADRRLSNGWTARLSYTWSRLHGNYSGLAHSDEEGRVAPNIGSAYDYPLRSFDERGQAVYGPLATDRPHQLKAHLLVDLPFGTSVGARWIGASGAPRTREAAFFPGVGVMYEGRLSDGRLPFLRQTDLYVQHQIGLGSRLRLTLSANVLNLLDQSTATDYFPDELFAGQLITVSEAQFFQGIDTQALIAQQRLVGDPRFLMSSGFQAPRTVRLGIKLSF
jgi:hypothetical protein